MIVKFNRSRMILRNRFEFWLNFSEYISHTNKLTPNFRKNEYFKIEFRTTSICTDYCSKLDRKQLISWTVGLGFLIPVNAANAVRTIEIPFREGNRSERIDKARQDRKKQQAGSRRCPPRIGLILSVGLVAPVVSRFRHDAILQSWYTCTHIYTRAEWSCLAANDAFRQDRGNRSEAKRVCRPRRADRTLDRLNGRLIKISL